MKYSLKKVAVFLALALFALPALAAGEEGIDVVKLIAKVVNFLIFFGGLGYLLKDVIGEFFTNRQKSIAEDLAMAEKSREEAKRRLDTLEEKMANLDKELEEIEKQAREEAEHEKKRIHDLAKHEAERITEQAKTEVENLRRQAIQELKVHITGLAVQEAEHQIREAVNKDEQERMFTEFTARLGAK
jgi:F-type H+-transporting ATPase subunit b